MCYPISQYCKRRLKVSQYIYPIPHTLLSRLGRAAPRKSSLFMAVLLAVLLFPLLAAAQPNKFLIGTDKGWVGLEIFSGDGEFDTKQGDTALTQTVEFSGREFRGTRLESENNFYSSIAISDSELLVTLPQGYTFISNNQHYRKVCSRTTEYTAGLLLGRVNLIEGSGRQTQWGLSYEDSETQTLAPGSRDCTDNLVQDTTSDNSKELNILFEQGVGNGVVVGFDLDDDLDEDDSEYNFSISKALSQSLVLRGIYGVDEVEEDEDSVGYSSKGYDLQLLIAGSENVLVRVIFSSVDGKYDDGDSLALSGFFLGIGYAF